MSEPQAFSPLLLSQAQKLHCKINSMDEASCTQCTSKTKCVSEDGCGGNPTDGVDVPKERMSIRKAVVMQRAQTEDRPEAALKGWYKDSGRLKPLSFQGV